eukprot:COSAG01_NODE_1421_length_10362_cov_10.007113_8_plen_1396_part_00
MPPAKRSGRGTRGAAAAKDEPGVPTRSTRGSSTRGSRSKPEDKVGTRGRGRRAAEAESAATAAATTAATAATAASDASSGRGAAKRKRDAEAAASKSEDSGPQSKAAAVGSLDAPVSAQQPASAASGVTLQTVDSAASAKASRTAQPNPAPTPVPSGRGRRGSKAASAQSSEPRMTKAQEARLREAEAAAVAKRREVALAKLAEEESRTFASEDKVLKQAKAVQKRYDQDTLVRRMTRYAEPPRKKTHWDYLLQEMEWMANDFRHERKWKMASAKKTAAAVMKHHKARRTQKDREKKMQEQAVKKIASRLSREVRTFWGQIGKLVVYKHEVQIEQIRQQHMEKHMDFMVGQTERYSRSLAENMIRPTSRARSQSSPAPADPTDTEFKPIDEGDGSAVDDETTIDQEEIDESLRSTEQEAVQEMELEGDQPIADVLAKYGVSEDAATAGMLPDPEVGENQEAEGEAGASGEVAAAQAGAAVSDTAESQGSQSDDEDDPDLSFLVDANSLELTEEEKGLHKRKTDRMKRAAASAKSLQPAGHTLATAGGEEQAIEVPFIVKAQLREYQHVALQWLMALYDKRLNGILADEMGLGKTLMTISLLAYLATERGIWGPHLIVVPTSVMLNWEIEFKKWAPCFKVLTYYGSQKERKEKRSGWSKENFFHICITSYQLVVQDHHVFRRKRWGYLILDEAHHIKNFQSQRWQTMLNFNAKRRLLITGTPLQNNLMELWSLMHFLMPHIFASHKEFKDWFSNPLNTAAAAGAQDSSSQLVQRLHGILRPFILRRLKSQVEQQLPGKTEHMVPCPLSPRQRVLYEEYMQRSDTKACLAGGNYIGIMNVVMQLRKVCNHPDLFEVRPIVSPFDVPAPTVRAGALIPTIVDHDPFVHTAAATSSSLVQLLALEHISAYDAKRSRELELSCTSMLKVAGLDTEPAQPPEDLPLLAKLRFGRRQRYRQARIAALQLMGSINHSRCQDTPVWGSDLIQLVTLQPFTANLQQVKEGPLYREIQVQRWWRCSEVVSASQDSRLASCVSTCMRTMCKSWIERAAEMLPIVKRTVFTIMKARSAPAALEVGPRTVTLNARTAAASKKLQVQGAPYVDLVRPFDIRKQLYFPDKRLVQFDCGKLQMLDKLLRQLKNNGHRCLLFTQMSKMLDVMEHFLNLYGYTYLRLDGSTKPDDRQRLMDRFNGDPRFFIFILSTRSGGVGINLTGADTVIFYDSDWNPSMDAQAQDRCHRIGQTREVHIYRLISEHTVEENILAKSKQKANLNAMVLQDGNFSSEAFKAWGAKEIKSLFEDSADGSDATKPDANTMEADNDGPSTAADQEVDIGEVQQAMASVEEETDNAAAKRAERESAAAEEDFREEKEPAVDKVNMEQKARREFLLALKRGRKGKDDKK